MLNTEIQDKTSNKIAGALEVRNRTWSRQAEKAFYLPEEALC